MKQILYILFIITSIYCNSVASMENTILIKANVPQLPQEIIAQIAGYCWPKEKNILMRVCKDFYSCLKDRALILKTNSSTVSLSDKEKDMFAYTYADNIEMMSFLLKNGAKSTWKNILGMTLFHIASDNKNTKAMQLLVDHGAHVNELKPQIHQLHEAIYNGDEEVVKTLLKLKVNPNLTFGKDVTPLYIASRQGHTTIVEALLYAGAKVDQTKENGWTPLHAASYHGHTNIAELLINVGADANQATDAGETPLLIASCNDHIEIIRLLIPKVDLNQVDADKRTALFLASEKGYTDIVQLLLDARANINITDKKRTSPLCIASYTGNIEVVQLLINGEAQVNQVNKFGWTPLAAASYNGYTEIVKLLLDNGANIHHALNTDSATDSIIKKGDAALQMAEKKGHTQVVELLNEQLQRKAMLKESKKKEYENNDHSFISYFSLR